MNVDHPKKLKHLSLCTGYGGIDIGLARALSGALRTVAYVEIEAFAVENLVSKIEGELLDVAPVFTDLKRFPWELYRGKVDIVSGGFPCQPFSSAGRRAGDDDPRHLFPYILDGLKRLGRPPLIFLENVEGIISSKLKGDGWSDPAGTPVLLHVLRELERVGYEATAGVFSAREVGAPHQRKRVFIMGCRSDLGKSGRAIVSRLLERGGKGLNLVKPCNNSGRRSRAPIHSDRRTVDGRGARVPSERGTSDFDTQYASSETMGHSESRYRPRWRVPELERFQVQAREPSTAPKTMGNTESRKDRQRGSRALDRAQPKKQRENGLSTTTSGRDRGAAYPAPRGRDQYSWEPPRVTVGNTRSREQRPPELESGLLQKPDREGETGIVKRPSYTHRTSTNDTREAQPAMGRDLDGTSGWMDYAKLSRSVDNRTDELRLLGNGVVPDTAARAFRVLWDQLTNENEKG